MTTMLFFDDNWLFARQGLRRRLGRPCLISEGIYRDPQAIIAMGSPTVYSDGQGGYLLFYGGFPLGATPKDRSVALLAHSDDGLNFAGVDTRGMVDIPDRVLPNQLISGELVHEMAMAYRDERAEPGKRYKALTLRYDNKAVRARNELWSSPDGMVWKKQEGCCWHARGAEPGVGLCYNPATKAYTLTVRPDMGERRIATCETMDFQTFSTPKWCMQADALDDPIAELYGMPIFPYKGMIIGFPWLYHVDGEERGIKFWRGRMDAQLAYSLNGSAFQRTLREPFLPNGDYGDPDFGVILPSSLLQMPDGSLRIYGFARTIEHGPYRRQEVSTIVAYALREDGFVYLETTGGTATLRTREMLLSTLPSFNLSTTGGATCAILGRDMVPLSGFSHQDCTPFFGDDTHWVPRFQDGDAQTLKNRVVTLELRLLTGRVYALSGDFVLLSGVAANRYEKTGIIDSIEGF